LRSDKRRECIGFQAGMNGREVGRDLNHSADFTDEEFSRAVFGMGLVSVWRRVVGVING